MAHENGPHGFCCCLCRDLLLCNYRAVKNGLGSQASAGVGSASARHLTMLGLTLTALAAAKTVLHSSCPLNLSSYTGPASCIMRQAAGLMPPNGCHFSPWWSRILWPFAIQILHCIEQLDADWMRKAVQARLCSAADLSACNDMKVWALGRGAS